MSNILNWSDEIPLNFPWTESASSGEHFKFRDEIMADKRPDQS